MRRRWRSALAGLFCLLPSGGGCSSGEQGPSSHPSPPVSSAPVPSPPPPPPPLDGVLCFRGGPRRDFAGSGTLPRGGVEILWKRSIGCIGEWCGLGWTGQPLLAAWGREAASLQSFLTPAPPRVEVIAAGLDGVVRFFDLDSGAPTRKELVAQDAPIKGTPSLDPRGLPVLFVGQGLKGKDGNWHYRAISLQKGETFGKTLVDLPGSRRTWDGTALHPFRGWGAFDSNALLLPERDLLVEAGENGVLYRVKLGARPLGALVSQPGREELPSLDAPQVSPLTYSSAHPKWGPAEPRDGTDRFAAGIESSVAFHEGILYWTDNVGSLVGYHLDRQEEVLRLDLGDDTDATPVIAVEQGNPVLYVGSEVDKTVPGRPILAQGMARLSKVDLTTGRFVWRLEVPCWTERGEDPLHDLNGGILSTVALGQGPSQDLVFVATAREPNASGGRLLAVRREVGPDGNPVIAWAGKLKGFAWSSPATDGKTVVVGDSSGWLSAFDAPTGELLWTLFLGAAVESSPVFWGDALVVGARGGWVMRVGVPPPK